MQLVQSGQRPLPLFSPAPHGKVLALRPVARQRPAAPAPVPARPSAHRPLRLVLRHADDGSCRLMASGRLADVCAELNRLALG
ncbi:hypothetical protein [Comamonas sp. NLF-1-9]|uniref:hypothetical protein n=1 Tax=Comamonas sp. NLF-1-9 TaxID=2853163 RepID=UPI001C47978E|nr:hypothetical protein [Comamonas sp. NLF-1-9]QXL85197.1 hypothetical protein KUD94_04270 [Comamonas sp. NLF-1-9]